MKKTIVVLLALIFVFPALSGAESGRFATVQKIQGEVMARASEMDVWAPAEEGMILFEKGELKTGLSSMAEVSLDKKDETGKFTLKENSLLRFTTMLQEAENKSKNTLLDLVLGKVLVRAAKLKGDSKFEVRTPTSTTGVRGTLFEVSVDTIEITA